MSASSFAGPIDRCRNCRKFIRAVSDDMGSTWVHVETGLYNCSETVAQPAPCPNCNNTGYYALDRCDCDSYLKERWDDAERVYERQRAQDASEGTA